MQTLTSRTETRSLTTYFQSWEKPVHFIHLKVSPVFCFLLVLMFESTAQSEGSIGMEEGEELEVVELDQGDGWTRVRKVASEEEGFVPTSYIEVEIAAC